MARTRRRQDRLVAWFPVLLMGVLAALTFWLDAKVQAPPRPRPDALKATYFVENFSASKMGPDGRVWQSLSATRAEYFNEDQSTRLVEPRFASTQPGRPVMRASADRGRATADVEDVFLEGNVTVVREPWEGRGPITMTSSHLQVIPRSERVLTDRRVRIQSEDGTAESTGLEFDNKARTLRLLSNVQITLQKPRP